MPSPQPAFVLVHGGWHDHSTWDKVVPILEASGFTALTLDLPGAGGHAIEPASLGRHPFDPDAFAAEPSPVAGLTQDARTRAVVTLVRDAAALGGGQVVLVGHSAGGVTVSAVAEQIPERLAAVVYLSGFLAPPGLFIGDPAAIGATRIHAGSSDEAYRALLKESFYADVSDADFVRMAARLHCDEPNDGALAPSEVTSARFGAVPRHYIRCTRDNAVPLTGQDHMIASVDAALGNRTTTHTLDSSHSPFLSQPDALARILIAIAGT